MNIKSLFKISIISTAATWICAANPPETWGATANVSVINDSFSPASTNIFVNDTVVWTWPSGSFNHNVTSTSSPQAWTASATQNGPVTFSHTFTTANTYPYDCTIHAGIGMVGSVKVSAAPNVPPTVAIIAPTNGTVYATPAAINLQATASDSDGTVTNVQFLVGSIIVSNRPATPFIASTNLQVAASYIISAVASDNLGAKNTNSVTISVVTPLPLTISSVQYSTGAVQFNYAANAGLSYVVQKTTNVAAPVWTPISTNRASASPVTFLDSHATNNPGFYRVGRMPNP